jgi:hypothetical protein
MATRSNDRMIGRSSLPKRQYKDVLFLNPFLDVTQAWLLTLA